MEKIKGIGNYKTYDSTPEELEPKEYAPYIQGFAEEIFTQSERINFGQSADVFRDPLNGCCYKVITRQSEALVSAEDEALFLMELQNIKSKVRVPIPLFSLEATIREEAAGKLVRKSLICMERVEGVSLKEVMEGKMKLPESFDLPMFFNHLTEFVNKMNMEGIYHRDLHEGNIMVDLETGMPWVIDFGLSRKKYLTDENPYETEINVKNKVFTFKNDLDEVRRVEKSLREHIDNHKDLKKKSSESPMDPSAFSFKNLENMKLEEIHSFKEILEDTVKQMTIEKVDVIHIPSSLGLWLVKDDTNEFEKRKQFKLVLYPKIIKGQKYFVCRN